MLSLISPAQAQVQIAKHFKQQRINCNYTQKELAIRSSVALASLRKFERTGIISLQSLLRIAVILGLLEKIIMSVEPKQQFNSLDEIIKMQNVKTRQRVRKNDRSPED